MSANDRSIPLPQFSGQEEDYLMWKGKMRGFAMAKGIWIALTDAGKLPGKEDAVLDEVKEEAAFKARKANSLLMAYLMNAFKKNSDTKIVMNASDDDWPSGKAVDVFDKLDQKYNPKDLQTDLELERKLQKVSMKKGDDPDTLFEQIDDIATWYDTTTKKIEESKKLSVIISKAHEDYQSILATTATTKGNALTLDDLQLVMKTFYRQSNSKRGTGASGANGQSKEDGEIQLLVIPGLENMICRKCRQKGHKAVQCPRKSNGGSNAHGSGGGKASRKQKFQGKCNLCDKPGHKADDCWENPQNAARRPSWWKAKTTTAWR
jgi:gag-polypeptide of LTR copia-type/Zinc knuckle